MADIELVVKIPEELYITYKSRPPMLGDAGMDMIAQSIANGTPLPKGHRFIDADEILNHAFIRDDEEGDIFVQKYYCIKKENVDNALVLFDTLEVEEQTDDSN